MTDKQAGTGAEVGAKKINSEGKIVQREGAAKNSSRIAWIILMILVALSTVGLWTLYEVVVTLL